MQTLIVVLLIVVVFIAAMFLSAWGMKRAVRFVLADLKRQKALDPASAVVLPYARTVLLRFGLRDYRPQAIAFLLKHNAVLLTDEGKFYLGKTEGLEGLAGAGDGKR